MEMLVENGVFRTPAGTCVTGTGRLQAAFDVTGFAVATMAEAGHAVARLVEHLGDSGGNGDSGLRSDSGLPVSLDLDLAERWFGMSFAPVGWELPPVWDPIAGDYPCDDGWIRLHTNAPHHRAAALQVLGLSEGAGQRPRPPSNAGRGRNWRRRLLPLTGAPLSCGRRRSGQCIPKGEPSRSNRWCTGALGVQLTLGPAARVGEWQQCNTLCRGCGSWI